MDGPNVGIILPGDERRRKRQARIAGFEKDPKYLVWYEDGVQQFKWLTKVAKKKPLALHGCVLDFLHEKLPSFQHNGLVSLPEHYNEDNLLIEGYTEYIHPKSKKRYRSHPDYHSNGPWYDWAFVRFTEQEDDSEGEVSLPDSVQPEECDMREGANPSKRCLPIAAEDKVPCKILAFIRIFEHDFAVVHPCRWQEYPKEQNSMLLECWQLDYAPMVSSTNQPKKRRVLENDGRNATNEDGKTARAKTIYQPQFYIVDVETIGERILVIEQNPGIHEGIDERNHINSSFCIVPKPRETVWAKQFFPTSSGEISIAKGDDDYLSENSLDDEE